MSLAPIKAGGLGLLMGRMCDDCGESKPPRGGQPMKRGTLVRWRCAECKVKAEAAKAEKAKRSKA